jgi:hypothetical protein
MKFSIPFKNLETARQARRDLLRRGLLHWSDLTSLHHRSIRVDRLPLRHTSARRGAVLGAVVVGISCALLLAVSATIFKLGFSITAAIAFGVGVGLLYGGVFGAIAYSTRPAPFIRSSEEVIGRDGALLVCDIVDPERAEEVREQLENDPTALAA